MTELQCDLLELRDAHAKLRTANEKLRRDKERHDRDRDQNKLLVGSLKRAQQVTMKHIKKKHHRLKNNSYQVFQSLHSLFLKESVLS